MPKTTPYAQNTQKHFEIALKTFVRDIKAISLLKALMCT